MSTYAAIASGYVCALQTDNAVPAWADELVDVTSTNPMPQIGWTYSGTSFAAPVSLQAPPMPEAARDLLTPAPGLIVFNTTQGYLERNDGGGWTTLE